MNRTNQHASAMADVAGKWQVMLDPMPASATSEVLTVAGRNKVSVADVLIGDVWVCSGQSNMQLQMKGTSNAAADIPAANRPLIRLLQVDHIASDAEQEDIRGQWAVCSPRTVAGFSAAGYYFGRDLQDAIKVPIGLIHSSWGGTTAEAWSAPESLRGNPILAPILSRYQDALRVLEPKMKEYRQAYAAWAPKA
jgi:sialate O-acetylesterase